MKKYEVVEFEAGDVIQFIGSSTGFQNGTVVVLIRSLGVFRVLGGGNRDSVHLTDAKLQDWYKEGQIDYLGNIANQNGGLHD